MSVTTIPGAVAGVVRDGVVVFSGGEALPEGTAVQVVPSAGNSRGPKSRGMPIDGNGSPIEMMPEELAEFEALERLSDEAWATIDWGEGEIAREEG